MRALLCLLSLLCLSGCGLQETDPLRSDEPVSRAIATYEADFDFPKNAKNVYYFVYSDGIKLYEFYRFDLELPRDSLGNPDGSLFDAFRPHLLKHSQVKQRSLDYPVERLSSDPELTPEFPQPEARFLPMTWWDPENVKQGFTVGEIKAGEIFIIIDEGNSRVYYHYFNE